MLPQSPISEKATGLFLEPYLNRLSTVVIALFTSQTLKRPLIAASTA